MTTSKLSKAMYLELKSYAENRYGQSDNMKTHRALVSRGCIVFRLNGKSIDLDHVTERGYAALKEYESTHAN